MFRNDIAYELKEELELDSGPDAGWNSSAVFSLWHRKDVPSSVEGWSKLKGVNPFRQPLFKNGINIKAGRENSRLIRLLTFLENPAKKGRTLKRVCERFHSIGQPDNVTNKILVGHKRLLGRTSEWRVWNFTLMSGHCGIIFLHGHCPGGILAGKKKCFQLIAKKHKDPTISVYKTKQMWIAKKNKHNWHQPKPFFGGGGIYLFIYY